MIKVFSSLKTTVALAATLVALSVWGSFAIQLCPDAYETIERDVLLTWLRNEGLARPLASWWVFAMIAIAALLTVNTCVCAGERLVFAFRRRTLPLRSLWAQVAHLGFLFVLAAHLIGSTVGFRSDGHPAFSGQEFSLAQRPGWVFRVDQVSVDYAPEGYPTALSAAVSVRSDAGALVQGLTSVNHPLFISGVATYLTAVRPSLRGCWLRTAGGEPVLAEFGKPVSFEGGTLVLSDWTRMPDGGAAIRVIWAPSDAPPYTDWLYPYRGTSLPIPAGPRLSWGDFAVEPLAIFDVRYDPGASVALMGGILLSVALVPLLWPRRRIGGAVGAPDRLSSAAPEPHPDNA